MVAWTRKRVAGETETEVYLKDTWERECEGLHDPLDMEGEQEEYFKVES